MCTKNRIHTPRCLVREAGSYFYVAVILLYGFVYSFWFGRYCAVGRSASVRSCARVRPVPSTSLYQHKFSDAFEEKMQSLIKGIGTTCYTVAIQDSVIHK